jgi:hypothetical protein
VTAAMRISESGLEDAIVVSVDIVSFPQETDRRLTGDGWKNDKRSRSRRLFLLISPHRDMMLKHGKQRKA